jgi:hypothetical protein
MARAPSRSPQREISPGSTPLPSFTGRQKRTSSRRYMMLTNYIAMCAAGVFTLTRWSRTHRAGHMLQSPCLMQTTVYTSVQPSFTGSHQRTSMSRLVLHVVTYIAIFVVWMLIWSRRGTHTAGLHRHSPFRVQYKYYSTRQLVANLWLRENTARHAITYGYVTRPVHPSAAAWGPT